MNLAQLHYFRKLAQLEHYTQAAQELFISQPSLSASISSMEEELHIKLFQKKGRNVKLTKDGREFYDYVCRALDTLQDGIDTAWERGGILSGTMDLAVPPSLLIQFVPDLIADYQEHSPTKMQFHFHSISSMQEMENGINKNIYDIGFSMNPASSPLISVPLCTRGIAAFVHPSHPLAQKSMVELLDLAEHPILTYGNNTPTGHAIHHAAKQHHLNISQMFDDEVTIYGYLSHDPKLVAIAPASPLLHSGNNLVSIPVTGLPKHLFSIYLIYSKENHIPKVMERFLAFVEKNFSVQKIA